MLVAESGQTWGYALIDAILAVWFWRLRRRSPLFAATLFLFCEFQVGLYLYTTLVATPYYWVAFITNRVFEISLLFVIGCSIYRIRALRRRRRDAPVARHDALIFSGAQ